MGEDFLDIAALSPENHSLNLARVDLRGIGTSPELNPESSHFGSNAITWLCTKLGERVPELRGAIVLVDSPRRPRGMDYSELAMPSPKNFDRGREIDAALRVLVRTLRRSKAASAFAPLSLFPTPPMGYFGAHLNIATCKPHLRLLGQALFGEALNRDYGPGSGGIFTRFMIAGFATYRALDGLAAEVYESYPDLQFRLWSNGQQLSSKNSASGAASALDSRVRILLALASELKINRPLQIQRIDEADAAILVLSTAAARRHNATFIIRNVHEGSFMLTLDQADAEYLQAAWSSGTLNVPLVDLQYDSQ